MKRKQRPPKAKAGPSQVAGAAGCSKQLASRLLKRGMTKGEIIERIADNKQREAALLDLPVVPVNGHAANGMMPFAQAQAAKENWLAELRRIEVMKARRELMPVAYMKLWGTNFLTEAKDLWLRGPSELRDALAAESDPAKCEAIVRGFCERVVERLSQLERLWNPPWPGAA
jgi:hypothetical protein